MCKSNARACVFARGSHRAAVVIECVHGVINSVYGLAGAQ